jgi:hypothetical protein
MNVWQRLMVTLVILWVGAMVVGFVWESIVHRREKNK